MSNVINLNDAPRGCQGRDTGKPRKALLCQVEFDRFSMRQLWLKPGEPKSLTEHLSDVADNLHMDIRYDIDLTNNLPNHEAVLTPSYRGQVMKDIYPSNNTVDLRWVNKLFLVLREHNLDANGRPTETLIDIYQIPLTKALAL